MTPAPRRCSTWPLRLGRLAALSLALAPLAASARGHEAVAAAAQTVYFPSADGKTELVGYLFEPPRYGPHPVVVMLHGRAGPYSTSVNAGCTWVGSGRSSPCGASTLSKRHQMWGAYWVEHGYFALLVDSFGPRGRAHGYGRNSHDDPDREAVNERTVRPLDAEAALAWLATVRGGLRMDRVMLQGWSNGASTTLNVMLRQADRPATGTDLRFRAALAFYPGCGPKALLSSKYRADAPVQVFLGSADEEVSPVVCADVLKAARGGPVTVTTFDGATHDFDDPGAARQGVDANRVAKDTAMRRSTELFDSLR